MGILDGDLAGVVSGAFGWLMLDALLHRPVTTTNGKGGFTIAEGPSIPVKAMIDVSTQAMREADGYSDTDVALMILRGVPAVEVSIENEITVRGDRYHILPPLSLDAAMTHYTARGRRK